MQKNPGRPVRDLERKVHEKLLTPPLNRPKFPVENDIRGHSNTDLGFPFIFCRFFMDIMIQKLPDVDINRAMDSNVYNKYINKYNELSR